jgi:hypothetical protein
MFCNLQMREGGRMRLIFSILSLVALAGCSLTPPKPAQCEGDFRPVNASIHTGMLMPMNKAQSLALCKKGANDGLNG